MLRKKEGKWLIRQAHKDLISSRPTRLRKFGQLGFSQPCKAGSQRWHGALLFPALPAWHHHFVTFVLAHDGMNPYLGSKVRTTNMEKMAALAFHLLWRCLSQMNQNLGNRHKTNKWRKKIPSGETLRTQVCTAALPGRRADPRQCSHCKSLMWSPGHQTELVASEGRWQQQPLVAGALPPTHACFCFCVTSAHGPARTSWLGCFDCCLAVAGIYKNHPNYSSP